jgi:hypothetical protein
VPTISPPAPFLLDHGGHGAKRAFAHPTISSRRDLVLLLSGRWAADWFKTIKLSERDYRRTPEQL